MSTGPEISARPGPQIFFPARPGPESILYKIGTVI